MHIPIPAILLPHTATLPHPFLLAAHAVPARRRLAASANQKSLLFPKKFRIFAQKGAAWTLGLASSKEKVLFGRQDAGCGARELQLNLKFKKPTLQTPHSTLYTLYTLQFGGRPSMSMSCCWTLAKNALANVAGCRLPRRGKVEGKTFRAWQMKWKHRASPNPQRSPQSKKKKEREGCRKQGSKSEKQHLMRKDIRKMQMCRKQTHAHCAPLCCALLFCSVLDAENRTKDEGLALDTPSCCRWRWPKVDGGGNGILGHVRRFRTPTSPGPLSMCVRVRVCGCAFACVLVHPVGPASPACLCVCTSAKVAKWRLEKSPSPLPLPPIAVVIRKSGKSNFGRSSSNSRSGQTKGGEWNFGASLFK